MRSLPIVLGTPGSLPSAESLSVTLASDQVIPLPTNAATADNQSTTISFLEGIVGNAASILSATQANSTALSAIEASVAAAPTAAAQAAAQATLNAIETNVALAPTAAAQATSNTALAAIEASVATVATATGQTSGNNTLAAILAAIQATVTIDGTVWYDATVTPPVYYVRRESVNEGTGVVSIVWETPAGVVATPTVNNLAAVSNAENLSNETLVYQASVAGTGFASGDTLLYAFGIDTATTPPHVAYSLWINAGPSVTPGTILATAPTAGSYAQVSAQSVSVTSTALAPNAATAAAQTTGNTSLSAIAASVAAAATAAAQTTGNTSLAAIATSAAAGATVAAQTTAQASLTAIAASVAAGPTAAGQATSQASLATIATNTTAAATAANQATIIADLATIATNTGNSATAAGTDATGVVVPTGGAGVRGWLSGIYATLKATLTVALSSAFTPTANSLSGTLTTANVDAVVLPANAARRFLMLYNTHATASLVVSLVGLTTAANAPLITLAPGTGLVLDVAVPNTAIHAQSTTAGATYSVIEG